MVFAMRSDALSRDWFLENSVGRSTFFCAGCLSSEPCSLTDMHIGPIVSSNRHLFRIARAGRTCRMNPSTYYRHSGQAPFGGVLLTLAGGVATAVILGAIYGFLIFWIPFIYINFFVTFGFALVLATAVGSLGMLGKIRNMSVLTVVALLVVLVAYYVHWSVWVGRMVEEQVTAPAELWAFVTTINMIGPWSIFGWTPNGFSLWFIWLLEAVMIFGIGIIAARSVIDVPYCEVTRQWTTESILPDHFMPIEASASIESPLALMRALQPVSESPNAYTEVSIATADGSDLRCVSVASVTIEQDKDGKEETKKTNIVKNMLLDSASFGQLTQLAGTP